jgi:hypothetical protein
MLAVLYLNELRSRAPRWRHLQWLLLVPVLIGSWQTWQYRPPVFHGVEGVVSRLVNGGAAGNLAYFGRSRQVFVPFVRMKDPARRIFTFQGDDITADSSIGDACRDYRVRYVVAEREDADFNRILPQIAAMREFVDLGPMQIEPTWRGPVELRVFRYDGPVAAQMKRVPLGSRFVTAQVNDGVRK